MAANLVIDSRTSFFYMNVDQDIFYKCSFDQIVCIAWPSTGVTPECKFNIHLCWLLYKCCCSPTSDRENLQEWTHPLRQGFHI